jgi:hypothetical protein
MTPIRVPVPRPFTRAPIKPRQRHADPRLKRTPKHPHKDTTE